MDKLRISRFGQLLVLWYLWTSHGSDRMMMLRGLFYEG